VDVSCPPGKPRAVGGGATASNSATQGSIPLFNGSPATDNEQANGWRADPFAPSGSTVTTVWVVCAP
jgi:hypothetical protein